MGAVGGMVPVQPFHRACCGGILARRGAGPSPAVEVGVRPCRSEGLPALLNLARLFQSFPGFGDGGKAEGGSCGRPALLKHSKTPQLLVGACQLYRRSTG